MPIGQLLPKLNTIQIIRLTDYEKMFVFDMNNKSKIYKYFKGEQETKALEIIKKYTGGV